MVDHFQMSSEFGILVFQRVEAMRAMGDDFLHTLLLKGSRIFAGQHVEQVFVACSAGRVAGATFIVPENGKADSRLFQRLDHRLGNFFAACIERTVAPDKI